MAYRDESGRITIDEAAAAADAARLREAAGLLAEAKDEFLKDLSDAEALEGNAAQFLAESSRNMADGAQELADACEETASDMERTVQYYEELDRNLRLAAENL